MQKKYLVNLSERGVFTIPIEIRRKYGLKKGMVLMAHSTGDGIAFEFPNTSGRLIVKRV